MTAMPLHNDSVLKKTTAYVKFNPINNIEWWLHAIWISIFYCRVKYYPRTFWSTHYPLGLFLLVKRGGWTVVTKHFALSIRSSLFSLPGVTSGDSEWLPSQRPALSSSQFNKTAPFMLVGFSSGNGFPQWVCLFLQVSHFFLCTAGPHSRSDLFHWLWFLKVSDPSLQASPALLEIWPHFGSTWLILYTLMQSEVARLNSLSLHPHPTNAHLTYKSLSSPTLVSKPPSWEPVPVFVGECKL